MDQPGASVTFVCDVLNYFEKKYDTIEVTQSELDNMINLLGQIESIIEGAKERKRRSYELGTTEGGSING